MTTLPRYIRLTAAAGVLTTAAFGGYVLSHLEVIPETGRRRLMLISPETERRLGEMNFRKILQQHQNQILPLTDPRAKMVRYVGERIAKASNRPDFNWEFVVIDSPEENAFCLPGGKICVYTGLFKQLRHQDGLAAVLSHEVAHALARHSAEQISLGSLFSIMLLFLSPEASTVVASAYSLAFDLPKSREHESEADAIGLDLMAKACFDPRASPEMFADWAKKDHIKAFKYFSTHPPSSERAQNLQKLLKGPMDRYNHHCHDVQKLYRN
ncbi:metalloprotease family M48X [Thraustotheca clavata]|uniref:Metalloprotease family M48X n=1 Tax=Thraustotheca clavata TaxID=74557 RepID=A0A1V9YZ82_9STRA|nr:metalloprotease family M48X [Thraustotheca clavata]